MDIVKKQAEAAIELESELAKARKSEHAYEEAMEVLQKDLDEMEAEVVKLKATRPGRFSFRFQLLTLLFLPLLEPSTNWLRNASLHATA